MGIHHRKCIPDAGVGQHGVVMTGLSPLIAVPLGIFAAIYLVEYAKRETGGGASCGLPLRP